MSNVATILAKKGSEVASVTESASVLSAARLMRERHIGSVVVLRGTTVVGIFTERDMLYRVVAEALNPSETSVGDAMTTPVTSCTPFSTLKECAQLMTNRRMRHIPVIENGKLTGIITSGDIIAYKVRHLEETNVFLQEYIHGPQAEVAEAAV
jgi:CBS domain-containing protein